MEPEEFSSAAEVLAPAPPEGAVPGGADPVPTPPERRFHLPGWLKDRENVSRAVFLLGPWVCYLMVEFLNNNDPFRSLTDLQVTLNLIWYYLIFWAVRMVTGRKGLGALLASGFCFLFGLANHYVLTFRGRIIFPCDLLTLGTAANVAGDFDYTPDRNVWIAVGLLAAYWLLIALAHRIFRRRGRQKLRWVTVAASCAAIVR